MALSLALVGATVSAAGGAARELLPADGMAAQGLVVDGSPVDEATPIGALVEARIQRRLDARVTVTHGGRVLVSATLAELGATVDRRAALRAVAAVGRSGSWWQRLDDAIEARRGRLAVAIPVVVPVEPLARRLAEFKAQHDRRPKAARWDFDRGQVIAHRDGTAVALYDALHAIELAAVAGTDEVTLPTRPLPPQATDAVVSSIDRTALVSTYETRFAYLGGQAGRAKNIKRASGAISGTVLLPGEVVSFNEIVGPRSTDNGFAPAGEIYKGEMRMGIGGGTCQVASTLYSAAFFGALDVVERSPHSRPSGYVPIGLDATVAYPHVDLKLRNPYDFPLMIRAIFEPGVLTFELWGARRPAQVDYDAATVRVQPYKRKIREAHWLADGKVVRKQKGIRGITIRKFRRIRYVGGAQRMEETTDVYPATDEVYLVSPTTDIEEALPPLPDGVELEEKTRRRLKAKQQKARDTETDGPTFPGEDEGLG